MQMYKIHLFFCLSLLSVISYLNRGTLFTFVTMSVKCYLNKYAKNALQSYYLMQINVKYSETSSC